MESPVRTSYQLARLSYIEEQENVNVPLTPTQVRPSHPQLLSSSEEHKNQSDGCDGLGRGSFGCGFLSILPPFPFPLSSSPKMSYSFPAVNIPSSPLSRSPITATISLICLLDPSLTATLPVSPFLPPPFVVVHPYPIPPSSFSSSSTPASAKAQTVPAVVRYFVLQLAASRVRRIHYQPPQVSPVPARRNTGM